MNKRLFLSLVLLLFGSGLIYSQISIAFEITEPSCNGFTDGSIVASVSGGMQPYTISWNTGASGLGLIGIGAGTYSITITDADNLTAADTVMLNEPEAVEAIVDFVGSVCINPGDVIASGMGGAAPYTFEWDDGSTDPQREDLDAGQHCVTVTDANGCKDNGCIIIPVPITLDFLSTPPSCTFGMDGMIVVIAQGGTPPYSYAWNNGATNSNNNNVLPGTYHVTVTDANGCLAFGSGIVAQGSSDLAISVTGTDPECPNTGSAAVVASGGELPYIYQWSNGQSSPAIDQLMGNMSYMVTVFDNNGCTATGGVFLAEGSDLSLSVEVSYNCGDPSGSATATLSGGLPPYDLEWTNGDTGPTATGLSPGQIYAVSVTDGEGCTLSKMFAVVDVNELTVDVVFDFIQPLCFGWCDASATAIVPGVDPGDLNYIWSTGQTSQTIINLPSGTFSVTVYDDNGCGGTGSIVIPDPPLLTLDLDIMDVECGMPGSGSAIANISGGTPPIDIIWSTGDTDDMATGLNPGTYTIIVTDANGCEVTQTFDIQSNGLEVMILGIDAACDEDSGSASTTVVGGTPPYTYQWSNGATTGAISNLAPGTYSVTVTDSEGCSGSSQVSIAGLGGPVCSIVISQEISSPGADDGALTASASDGAPPYTFEWSDGQSGETAVGLGPGTYSVTVTDAEGCSSVCVLELPAVPCVPLNDPGTIGFDQVLCGPGNDPDPLVNLTLPSGGTGTVEYLWMKSTVGGPFNGGYWEIIPNSNSPEYDPGPIFETTFFARCARIEDCGSFLESNILTIEVQDVAVASIIPPELPVCVGEEVVFSALDNGPGATYSWDFGPGAQPQMSSEITQSVTYISLGIRTISLTVTKDGCTSTGFMNITVTTGPICGIGLSIDANIFGPESVVVSWEMEKDLGTFDYIVEKSPDGLAFEEIGMVVNQTGETENHRYYEFMDEDPKWGRAFYRVRFQHPDGGAIYSNIDDVVRRRDGDYAIMVYPNPFRYGFLVEVLDESDHGPVTLDIRAASGTGVKKEIMEQEELQKEINMSNYPSGVYFLRVWYGDRSMKTFRLVKFYD